MTKYLLSCFVSHEASLFPSFLFDFFFPHLCCLFCSYSVSSTWLERKKTFKTNKRSGVRQKTVNGSFYGIKKSERQLLQQEESQQQVKLCRRKGK